MGGSAKGGSSSPKKNFATIACVIGKGPLYGIVRILLSGEVVWSGPLLRGTSSTPVNLVTKYGSIRLYWGTEDQPTDSTLNQYEAHPSYPGIAYVVFVDFDHGQSTNAYNAEFIVLGGAPDQSLITGEAATAGTDGNLTVNPIAQAAEVLTAPAWLGLAASDIDTASAQAVADAVQAEKVGGRCSAALSPLYDAQDDARKVLSDLASLADAWLRVNAAGKVEFGRWEKAPDAAQVRTVTFDDLAEGEFPSVTLEDASDTPNSFAIDFTDRTAMHKGARIAIDDLAGIEAAGGILRRNNLAAPHLISYEQALRAGQDAIRLAQKSGRWAGKVRFPKALNFAGTRILPGDLLTVPISAPGQSIAYQMIRVESVTYPRDATAGVEVEGRFQPGVAATHTSAWVPPVAEEPDPSVPPINLMRVFSLPAALAGEQPPLHIVACRPEGTSAGISVRYDDSLAGDFPALGLQGSYALPLTIDTTVAAGASTLRLSLLPTGANGQRYDRDASFIRNWTGGAVEGRANSLVAVLVSLSAGAITAIEACSVAGTPTLVDVDTFDVPVLRGRLGTSARSWTAGAFASVEVWLIPFGALVDFAHEDFLKSAATGSALYFHAGAYDQYGEYDPGVAFTERTRRVTEGIQLGEYTAQPDATTLVPVQSFVVTAGHYSAKAGFGVLDNDSATIPSAADGSGPVFSPGSVTTMQVFLDGKDDSINWTFSATPSTGVTGNLVGRMWTTTGFTVDSGHVDITATKSGFANVVCRFTLAKARAGSAGANGSNGTNGTNGLAVALVHLYRRAASAPAVPSTTSTFVFATAVLTGHDNGWTQTVPANDGNPLYITTAAASSSGASDTIATGEWATPVVMAQNGANGSNGLDGTNGTPGSNGTNGTNGQTSYFHVAFANSADGSVGFNQTAGTYIGTYVDFTPADSPNYWAYTWRLFKGADGANGTNGIPGANGENGQTSYLHIKYSNDGGATFTANSGETVGTYIGTYTDFTLADSNSVGAYTWALIRGADGTNGTPGSNGVNAVTVFLFQRTASATAPALPSGDCTYTFSTKSLTGHNNGWATSMPTAGGAYRWQTTATALSATDTDTIPPGEWSPAAISAQDGSNGANGADATAYWLVSSASTLKLADSTFTPASVTFTGKSQTGTGTPADYAGRFIIAESTDGTNFSTVYTSSGNEASKVWTPSGTTVKAIRCRSYLAGGTTSQLDEETVSVVNDGSTGGGVLGTVSGSGNTGSNYNNWVTVSAFDLTITCPAGTRKVTFCGTCVNADGATSTVNAAMFNATTSTTLVSTSFGAVTGGSGHTITLIATFNQASQGTVTVTMRGYKSGSTGNCVIAGQFMIE